MEYVNRRMLETAAAGQFVCRHVCICVFVRMNVSMCICVYMYVQIYMFVHMYECVSMGECMYLGFYIAHLLNLAEALSIMGVP